jgi:AraC-like DNA-binding protein
LNPKSTISEAGSSQATPDTRMHQPDQDRFRRVRPEDMCFAIVAHELRNPIGAIRSAVSLMESAGTHPDAMEQARRVIARQVGQLSVLVEDLLEFPNLSRAELRVKRERIDVVSEVEAAVESCAWAVKAGGQTLRLHLPTSPLYGYVDGPRIRQALTNLLDNACKYTKPFGRIEVALEAVGALAVFTVQDNGSGIVRDRLPHVFDLFERGSRGHAGAVRGLGVGLALVREIARWHGGDVSATSSGPGCGSTFVLRLPVLASLSVPLQAAEVPGGAGSPTKWSERPVLAVPRPDVVPGGLAAWQLKRVLDYIEKNLARPMKVIDVASVTRLSPCYFARAFKRSFGLSVHLYLMHRRVELAQQLMVSTCEPLSKIALSCGMSDQSHLTHWFRRVLGETPNTWRRAHRVTPFLVNRRSEAGHSISDKATATHAFCKGIPTCLP